MEVLCDYGVSRDGEELYWSEEGLSGTIPAEIGALSGLTALLLYNNTPNGKVPPELGNVTSLKYMHLFNNSLSGTVPSSLSKLTNLSCISLHTYNFAAAVPDDIISNNKEAKTTFHF